MRLKIMLFCCLCLMTALCEGASDPLPSWIEGSAKEAIIDFVQTTTTEGSKNFIPITERIAVFDQDGTLWVEQPIYTQFMFAMDSMKSLSDKKLSWHNQEPYKSIIKGDLEKVKNFTLQDIENVVVTTHAGMTVEEFNDQVKQWLQTAQHPRFKKPYKELIYQPMVEVIQLMKQNDYKIYIVSGSGQEFIRTYSEKVYGVPVEQVIGSAGKVKYEYRDGNPILVKLPEMLYIDDKAGKPEAINLIIGKKAVAAFGNSDGDQQMLEWTQSNKKRTLQLLVHHDDAVREYDYGPDSKIGTFSEKLMNEAKKNHWIVVSMKNDWKVIFPFEKK